MYLQNLVKQWQIVNWKQELQIILFKQHKQQRCLHGVGRILKYLVSLFTIGEK